MERCFCPQACYKHRELRRINTHEGQRCRSTIRPQRAHPEGKRRQEKVTVEEKGDEERTEGKREAERDTKHFPNDARHDNTGGDREGNKEVDGGMGWRIKRRRK